MTKSKLPALADLINDDNMAVRKTEGDLQVLLNQEPSQKWVKIHPMHKGIKYIPIERIEWLLTRIFVRWWVEVLDTKQIGNAVTVTIRLKYLNPIDGETLYTEGVGAAPLQTTKGAGAVDFNELKSDAVMKALPAAKSYAIKDAAETLGKLFGKDLNRADTIMYNTIIQENIVDVRSSTATYIYSLLDYCTLDEMKREAIRKELDEGVSPMRANDIINMLNEHQQNPVRERGTASQTESAKHAKRTSETV